MRNENGNQVSALTAQIDTALEPYFLKKAPQLPANIREIIVKIVPYFTVIGVIIAAMGLLLAVGITAVATPALLFLGGMGGAQAVAGGVVGLVFLVIQGILEAMAIPGLFKRQKAAWNLLFLANIVGAIYNLISLNIIGLVVGFLISFYLLYQIKSYYK